MAAWLVVAQKPRFSSRPDYMRVCMCVFLAEDERERETRVRVTTILGLGLCEQRLVRGDIVICSCILVDDPAWDGEWMGMHLKLVGICVTYGLR